MVKCCDRTEQRFAKKMVHPFCFSTVTGRFLLVGGWSGHPDFCTTNARLKLKDLKVHSTLELLQKDSPWGLQVRFDNNFKGNFLYFIIFYIQQNKVLNDLLDYLSIIYHTQKTSWLLSNLYYNDIDNSKSGVTTLKTENGELLQDSQILACQQMHFSCKF